MRWRIWNLLLLGLAWTSALSLLLLIGLLLVFLSMRASSVLDSRLFLGNTALLDALLGRRAVTGGLLPAVAGTLGLVLLAVTLAVPVGVAAGIYLAEYAGARVRSALTLVFDVMAGIPSIVIGLCGFAIAVSLHRAFPGRLGPSLLLSALALAFLVLPYLVRATQGALIAVDPAVRRTALALGATRLQNLRLVLLPDRMADITSGVFLALGRCAEDTAAILLTGVVATAGMPRALDQPYEALPFYVYYMSSQYADTTELASGYAAALVLLVVCSVLLLCAFGLQRTLRSSLLFGR